jgi:hypothetical protein
MQCFTPTVASDKKSRSTASETTPSSLTMANTELSKTGSTNLSTATTQFSTTATTEFITTTNNEASSSSSNKAPETKTNGTSENAGDGKTLVADIGSKSGAKGSGIGNENDSILMLAGLTIFLAISRVFLSR